MPIKVLLLGLFILILAGCATTSSYVSYTSKRFPPKDKFYPVNVYSKLQVPSAGHPYDVIGKVSVEGFASDGVNPGTLTNQAEKISRKRGADAIINARIEEVRYLGGDALLRFKGELIVYTPATTK